MDYSFKFSPYLALGCISPREIDEKVKAYEQEIKKNQSTWWLIFELVWRDYFTFKSMRFKDAIFKTKGYKNKSYPWEMSIRNLKSGTEAKPVSPLSMPICAS